MFDDDAGRRVKFRHTGKRRIRIRLFAAARDACRPLVDDAVWDATVFWALCEIGWNKALDAASHPDPGQRATAAAELAWWVQRADAALYRNAAALL